MNFSDQGILPVVFRTNLAYTEKLFPHCSEIDLKHTIISVLQSPSIKLPSASSLSRLRGGV